MDCVIALLIGIILGCLITYILTGFKVIGYLQVNTSDPNEDNFMFLELHKNVNEVRKSKYVTFEVKSDSQR